ncbi:alpha/beta hydrolase [Haloechinothrix sp. LS1_15]|uniref:alpha/beta hydrolase n=1 Tax=Haloechinothrix sp. LS1_15 TaxID=2652248 RepID=UPI0029443106|nr:alpha/beta hydrolase [Haloechinothrix sp. LS1_15]MDV6014201.1 hypothetical protein [Haloechinothrix sp. LS1_15]
MTAWSDVLRWSPGALDSAADALTTRRKSLTNVLATIEDGSAPRDWRGDAAEAADRSLRQRRDDLETLVTGIASMVDALDAASEAVAAVLHAVDEADGLAQHHQFRITEQGRVLDVAVDLGNTPEDVVRTRAAVEAELEDRIAQILRRAAEIDDDLVTAMARLTGDGGATGPAAYLDALNEKLWGDAPSPPLSGSPSEIAAWWATLSDGEREWLITNRPERIGGMDGLPITARSEANMLRLPVERERLDTELDELRAEREDLFAWQWLRDRQLSSEIAQIEAKLDSLDAVEDMMADENRTLITLDLDGERARAAIGSGDVDTAEKVSVFTPGMNSTVDGNLARYVEEMEQVQEEAQDMLDDDPFTNGQEVASVVWLDYEPPLVEVPELLAGAERARFEEGAQRLAPFLDGLQANRDGDTPMHLTAAGHSYGSSTTGLALRETSAADAALFHGSPGVGFVTPDPTAGEGHLDSDSGEEVWTDSHQMQVPEGSLYNLSNEDDFVSNIGWHGVNPSLDRHITELSTEDAVAADGTELHRTEGHTSYVELRDPGDESLSTSEYNSAAVIADKTDLLIEQPR